MIPAPRITAALLIAGLALVAVTRPPDARSSGQAQADVPSFARDVPVIRSGEPIFRFNGQDLTGFYPYVRDRGRNDPNRVFTVRDGMICVSGQEFGGLTTSDEFQD